MPNDRKAPTVTVLEREPAPKQRSGPLDRILEQLGNTAAPSQPVQASIADSTQDEEPSAQELTSAEYTRKPGESSASKKPSTDPGARGGGFFDGVWTDTSTNTSLLDLTEVAPSTERLQLDDGLSTPDDLSVIGSEFVRPFSKGKGKGVFVRTGEKAGNSQERDYGKRLGKGKDLPHQDRFFLEKELAKEQKRSHFQEEEAQKAQKEWSRKFDEKIAEERNPQALLRKQCVKKAEDLNDLAGRSLKIIGDSHRVIDRIGKSIRKYIDIDNQGKVNVEGFNQYCQSRSWEEKTQALVEIFEQYLVYVKVEKDSRALILEKNDELGSDQTLDELIWEYLSPEQGEEEVASELRKTLFEKVKLTEGKEVIQNASEILKSFLTTKSRRSSKKILSRVGEKLQNTLYKLEDIRTAYPALKNSDLEYAIYRPLVKLEGIVERLIEAQKVLDVDSGIEIENAKKAASVEAESSTESSTSAPSITADEYITRNSSQLTLKAYQYKDDDTATMTSKRFRNRNGDSCLSEGSASEVRSQKRPRRSSGVSTSRRRLLLQFLRKLYLKLKEEVKDWTESMENKWERFQNMLIRNPDAVVLRNLTDESVLWHLQNSSIYVTGVNKPKEHSAHVARHRRVRYRDHRDRYVRRKSQYVLSQENPSLLDTSTQKKIGDFAPESSKANQKVTDWVDTVSLAASNSVTGTAMEPLQDKQDVAEVVTVVTREEVAQEELLITTPKQKKGVIISDKTEERTMAYQDENEIVSNNVASSDIASIKGWRDSGNTDSVEEQRKASTFIGSVKNPEDQEKACTTREGHRERRERISETRDHDSERSVHHRRRAEAVVSTTESHHTASSQDSASTIRAKGTARGEHSETRDHDPVRSGHHNRRRRRAEAVSTTTESHAASSEASSSTDRAKKSIREECEERRKRDSERSDHRYSRRRGSEMVTRESHAASSQASSSTDRAKESIREEHKKTRDHDPARSGHHNRRRRRSDEKGADYFSQQSSSSQASQTKEVTFMKEGGSLFFGLVKRSTKTVTGAAEDVLPLVNSGWTQVESDETQRPYRKSW